MKSLLKSFSAVILLVVSAALSFSFISLDVPTSENQTEEEPVVRVRIINTMDSININFLDSWSCNTSNENEKLFFSTKDSILLFFKNGKIHLSKNEFTLIEDSLIFEPSTDLSQLEIESVPYGIGWWWEGIENRTYEGNISIYTGANNKLEVVVTLPLETYLLGVVPYEIGGDSPIESLKAQAIAARSEAIIALISKIYSGDHYDLTSDVECQVFSGNNKRTAISDLAVKQTRGMILTENDKPINAYYASNCGGHSESISNVWPARERFQSYLSPRSDSENPENLNLSDEDKVRKWIFSEPEVYCNPNLGTTLPNWSQNNFRWKKEFTIEHLTEMFSKGKSYGELLDIKILHRGPSGRILSARFIFEKESFDVNGELAIRMMWQPALRSSCFIIDKTEDSFIMYGAGWGHGVGMCQSGAVYLALNGKDYKEILNHYYPSAQINFLY